MGLVSALVDYHYGSGNGDVAQEMMLTGPERRVLNDFPLDRGGDQIYTAIFFEGLKPTLLAGVGSSPGGRKNPH